MEIGVLVDVYFMKVIGDDVVVFCHLPDLQVGEVSQIPDRTVEGVKVFLQRLYDSVHCNALVCLAQDDIVELFFAGAFENLAHQEHCPQLVDCDRLAEVGLLEEFAETGAVDFFLSAVHPGDGSHILGDEGEVLLSLRVAAAGDAAVVRVEAVDAVVFAATLAEEDLVSFLDNMEIELSLALLLAAADVVGIEKVVVVFLEIVVD